MKLGFDWSNGFGKEDFFESGGRQHQRTTDGQTPEELYTISSTCEPAAQVEPPAQVS